MNTFRLLKTAPYYFMSKLYTEMKNAVIYLGFAELVVYRVVTFYRT